MNTSHVTERPGHRCAWTSFWFTPRDPAGLHALRLVSGLLFLTWLLTLAGQRQAFFGLDGWFDRQAYREASRLPGGPPTPLGWSALYLAGSSPALLNAVYWGSVAILALFTLGVAPRLTAVLTWVVVASFTASPAAGFEADYLLGILAFYLMLGYLLLGQWDGSRSLTARLLGPANAWFSGPWSPARPSYAANLAVRLLQVHFAAIVCVSGLHKLQFGDWWAGVAFWYPLHPPFETTPDALRARMAEGTSYLVTLSLMQYVALAWQIGFPAFAWRRSWRFVVLAGGVFGWLGSVFLYAQPLFGSVYLIGCLSYLASESWRALVSWSARRVGAREQGPHFTPAVKAEAEVVQV